MSVSQSVHFIRTAKYSKVYNYLHKCIIHFTLKVNTQEYIITKRRKFIIDQIDLHTMYKEN